MSSVAVRSTPSIWALDRPASAAQARFDNQARPASRVTTSQWLERAWADAEREGREARWHALPDAIGDLAIEHGFCEADRMFLSVRSLSLAPAPAAAATSALGRVAEDNPDQREAICLSLAIVLTRHPSPTVRLAAVEAIWQAGATDLRGLLSEVGRREPDPTVRVTIEHAVRVLR